MEGETRQVFDLIDSLMPWHVTEVLLAIGVVLILIDYFFRTDWPAHLGYFFIAASTFFIAYRARVGPVWCLAVFLGVWILLAVLHRLYFRQFLTNAHEVRESKLSSEAR